MALSVIVAVLIRTSASVGSSPQSSGFPILGLAAGHRLVRASLPQLIRTKFIDECGHPAPVEQVTILILKCSGVSVAKVAKVN